MLMGTSKKRPFETFLFRAKILCVIEEKKVIVIFVVYIFMSTSLQFYLLIIRNKIKGAFCDTFDLRKALIGGLVPDAYL